MVNETKTYEQVRAFVARVQHSVLRIDVEFSAVPDHFSRCDVQVVQIDTGGWMGKYWQQHPLYKGEWWVVGQTSLFDDVATGNCATTPAEVMTLKSLLCATQYGARFHRWAHEIEGAIGALSIITHMTDG